MIPRYWVMETWVLLVWGLLLSVQMAHNKLSGSKHPCMPIMVDFCQDLDYNMTAHPTGASGYNLQKLRQIVETGCSPDVATFLCGLVSPNCVSEENDNIPPCHSLCERVKRDCEPVLREKGLTWPRKIRCEAYPIQSCANVSMIVVNCRQHHTQVFLLHFGNA